MAKIAVISPNDRCCMGARQLSSLVKNRHEYYLVCYGEYHHATFSDTARVGDAIEERLLLDLLRRLSPDLVGFSYRSVQAQLVTHLAGRIRSELHLPVMMGGIGATSEADEAIKRSDVVCVGEGDFVLPSLLDAIDRTGSLYRALPKAPNLWYHTQTGIEKNPMERLVSKEELSEWPFIDYDGANKFSIVRGKLIENDGRFDNDLGAYPMLTSRGCPFACTFCHNSNVQDLYRGQKYCRQRSVESVIRELEQAKANPATSMISIYDDLFTFNGEWALEFAAEYKKRVALPFWCYTHPSKVNREVFEALVEAGLDNTAMGVQSGSERTLYKIFNRKTPRSKIIEAAAVLKDLKCRAQIDLITANSFETDDDRRDTLDLMLAMPKNTRTSDYDRAWYYCQSRLTYFPNSRISQMVEEQGIDTDFDPDVASFWEMLHELAFKDYLPGSAVMYLSYLYDEYKSTAKDFKPETGAEWTWTNLLDRPMEETARLFEGEEGVREIERALGWIPTVEELSFSEVRVLMDAVAAPGTDADGAESGRRIMLARDLLKHLSAGNRMRRVKESLRSRAVLVAKLADAIGTRAAEKQELWKEVEARGKWGVQLDRDVRERDETIEKLQGELEQRTRWALGMEQELKQREALRPS
ncbi:MAG: radical SAM protein [Candidatus Eisenbacteria sp.]|nr:radical SAM protein [Candidatus Eisenbacteria bacterium]